MSVQAKFRCTKWEKIQHTPDGDPQFNVAFGAVYGPENEPWSKFTPSGSLTMAITNPSAGEWFLVGQEYILTFDLVPAPEKETA